jgi:chloramphenicol-sensitive protein RarD
VEPVLLVVAAVALLGESLEPNDLAVYGPIAVALVLLAVESVRQFRRDRA